MAESPTPPFSRAHVLIAALAVVYATSSAWGAGQSPLTRGVSSLPARAQALLRPTADPAGISGSPPALPPPVHAAPAAQGVWHRVLRTDEESAFYATNRGLMNEVHSM